MDNAASVNSNWEKGPVDPHAVCHLWGMGRSHTQLLHLHPQLTQRAVAVAQLAHTAKSRSHPDHVETEYQPMSYEAALAVAEQCPLCPRRAVGNFGEPDRWIRAPDGAGDGDGSANEGSGGGWRRQ